MLSHQIYPLMLLELKKLIADVSVKVIVMKAFMVLWLIDTETELYAKE